MQVRTGVRETRDWPLCREAVAAGAGLLERFADAPRFFICSNRECWHRAESADEMMEHGLRVHNRCTAPGHQFGPSVQLMVELPIGAETS